MIINISDLINPEDPEGRTYREINAAQKHNFPIGSLVEISDTGERLLILQQTRDCDMTPLYTLTFSGCHEGWRGYPESCLRLIK